MRSGPLPGALRLLELNRSPAHPAFAHQEDLLNFQHIKLRPRMSVLENVMLGAYTRTATGLVAGILRSIGGQKLPSVPKRCSARSGWIGIKGGDHAGDLPLGQQRVVEIAPRSPLIQSFLCWTNQLLVCGSSKKGDWSTFFARCEH